VLHIAPENVPIHPIIIVGVAVATESALTNEISVQIECVTSDYLSKERNVEHKITLFHPLGSRFTTQTSAAKRGSSIFFSGSLSVIDDKLYVELHNFSFIRINQTFTSLSEKRMPWSSNKSPEVSSNPMNIAQTIHNMKKSTPPSENLSTKKFLSTDDPSTPVRTGKSSNHTTNDPPTPTPTPKVRTNKSSNRTTDNIDPPTPTTRTTRKRQQLTSASETRTTRSSANTKKHKLSDIASDILADAEETEDAEDIVYIEDIESVRNVE
jgi:hypothetical protein